MIFLFVFQLEEVIYNTLPFQSMFLLFSWHKWLLFLLRKKGKSCVNICYFKPCFSHFLDINGFCFPSGSRGSYLSHFAISSCVSAIFLTLMTFLFPLEAGEVNHNTLPFQFMFLLFSSRKLLLLSFWKQRKLFNTICYFNPFSSIFWT